MDINTDEPIKRIPILENDYYMTPKGTLYNKKGKIITGFKVNNMIFHEFIIKKRRRRFSRFDLLIATWGDLFHE